MTKTAGGNFELLACLDGNTLRDPLTGQPMHSAIGPMQEALQIYLGPSRLQHRLQHGLAPLVLWDVGMGIAANSAAALSLRGARPLELHSFENDLTGLEAALAAPAGFPHLEPLRAFLPELLERGTVDVGPHTWQLHRGDFTSTLPAAPPAEVIFYDFYSPRVCGNLWSVPVMQAVRALSPRATLVTYSAATPVRLALFLAGWWVGKGGSEGPITALKNESTAAVASREELPWLLAPLGPEWLQKFRSSTQARPYAAAVPEAGAGSGANLGPDPWSQASFEELEAELLKHPQLSP